MGCPYLAKSELYGEMATLLCSETTTPPDPKYSLKYCKSERDFEKCAYFHLKRWKSRAHFDLRQVESNKYTGLKKLDSSQMLRGIIRRLIRRLNNCEQCKSLQSRGTKRRLCFLHQFYIEKTAYALQEIHGFNNLNPLSFYMSKHGPESIEISSFLSGQQLLTMWSLSKDDAYGKLGFGGLEAEERGLFYKLIDRYLNMPKKQLEILTTKHYELTHKNEFDRIIESMKNYYENIVDYEKEVRVLLKLI